MQTCCVFTTKQHNNYPIDIGKIYIPMDEFSHVIYSNVFANKDKDKT